ncbi:MAG: DUF924 family protein [Rhodospirillales bacterium]
MTDALAKRILDFWLKPRDAAGQPLYRPEWFKRDDALDAAIAAQFKDAVEQALAGRLDAMAEDTDGALALVILLDQFPRNLYRGTAKAFAGDAQALRLAKQIVERGWDRALPLYSRMFVYLPFEHSENREDQERSVQLVADLHNDNLRKYAIGHRDIVARFGRFPHRNAALGRASTAEEIEFLKQPGSSF